MMIFILSHNGFRSLVFMKPPECVMPTKGGWNCHQFHANSEFYSNHSVYDVKITVPKEYVVGSGGMLM